MEKIYSLISGAKSLTRWPSKGEIRYLSFLTADFILKTDVPLPKIPSYIDASDVFVNYNRYHSQDTDVVISILMTKHNQRYKLRKACKQAFMDEESLIKNLKRIYPLKRFDDFRSIFDYNLMQRLYMSGNEILLMAEDPKALFSDTYFIQRYCLGNIIYLFTDKDVEIERHSSINSFVMEEDRIIYIDSSGIKYYFMFSK